MMRRKAGQVVVFSLLLSGLMVLPAGGATKPGGLSITPIYTDLPLAAANQAASLTVSLANNSEVEQPFQLSVVDFGSLDEEGGVAFLGQPAQELEHKYGLAAWMKLDQSAVIIPAGKSVEVTVTVENRSSLAPGGHYGAVLATAFTQGSGSSNQPRVGVKQVLSSLILLTKEGSTQVQLRLVSQVTDARWWRLPSKVDHRFENQGNVHVVPRGIVEIIDPTGRIVRRGALNDGSGAVLPGSFRRYHLNLNELATAWLPGQYQVTTSYHSDGTDVQQRLVTRFWYAGSLLVWIGLLGFTVLMVAAGWALHRHRSWRPARWFKTRSGRR